VFTESFSFQLPAVINFVGGGGKTGLILKLAEEFSAAIPVIYTTTTRIHPPHPAGGLTIVSSNNPHWLRCMLERVGRQHSMRSRIFGRSWKGRARPSTFGCSSASICNDPLRIQVRTPPSLPN